MVLDFLKAHVFGGYYYLSFKRAEAVGKYKVTLPDVPS